jgi:hypothetical protein
MDYSFLIGVHHVDALTDSGGVRRRRKKKFLLQFIFIKDRATANALSTPAGK